MRPALAPTLALCLGTAIAAVPLWPVYESPAYVVMVAVTTAAAAVAAATAAVRRLPVSTVVLAGVVLYLLLGVPLAVPSSAAYGVLPTIPGLRELVAGTALGWKQLLTITLPVGSFQQLLVPPFLVVLVTVLASVSVALRSRRGAVAVAGPLVLFLVGIAFGPEAGFLPLASGLTLTVAILLWFVAARVRRRAVAVRRAGVSTGRDAAAVARRGLASALAVIVLAGAGATAAAVALPPRTDRDVLRARVVQPFDPREYPSPLSGFRRYHQPDRADAPLLTLSGDAAGERIRIAALDAYDGVVFSAGGDGTAGEADTFTLVPGRFDQTTVDGRRATLEVTVDDYAGTWLPMTGRLEEVRFGGTGATAARESFYYNDATGTAAVIDGVGSGTTYRIAAVVPPQPDEGEVADLAPGDAGVPDVAVSPEIEARLDDYVGSVEGTGARLAAMLDGLRADGYVSHGTDGEEPSRSGHSLDRIGELLTEPRMIGDEEQYAVAAALMARRIGFPSRVVVGFAPTEDGASAVRTVTGSDVSAWIEVDTTRWGWVALDPTPPPRPIPEELPEEPREVARPQSPVQPPVEEPEVPDEQQPPDSPQEDPEVVDPLLAALLVAVRVAGWVLVAAAVVASPFLAIIAAKWRRRRRRRRAPTPRERIEGGWAEFEDAVVDHGYRTPDASTRTEFAAAIGGPRSLVLAAETDRAVFAPDRPADADADRVWNSVDELRAALGARRSRWQRLRSRVSLRSLSRSRGAGRP